jgi:hypothetical protein
MAYTEDTSVRLRYIYWWTDTTPNMIQLSFSIHAFFQP